MDNEAKECVICGRNVPYGGRFFIQVGNDSALPNGKYQMNIGKNYPICRPCSFKFIRIMNRLVEERMKNGDEKGLRDNLHEMHTSDKREAAGS